MEPRTSRTAPRAADPAHTAAALAHAAELVRAPLDRILPILSAATAPLVPHTVAAELSGQCAHSPFKTHGAPHGETGAHTPAGPRGETATAGRITAAELQALAPLVTPGQVWQGTAVIGGVERAVVAAASEAAPMAAQPPLLVLVRTGTGPELTAQDATTVQHLWDLASGHRARISIEAVPGALAQSRSTAAERARVIAELGEAHEAALTALLGVLRARSLDDRDARARAVDLAASALVALRATADRDHQLTEEPAGEAFTRLADSLRPLLRHCEVRLEVAPPEAETAEKPVPAEIAHLARAAVRTLVLAQAGQDGVRRVHVRWRIAECRLIASVRDDGPGEPACAALDTHRIAQRLAALGGTLTVDALPGWGTTVTAALPLGTAPGPRLDPLSELHPRETEVLGHLARGHRNRAIAEALHISESTVKFHVANILAKLGVSSRGEAAALLHTVA
ncbi:response regulator transcription factor family protein [Streptomyces sp. NBC_00083]|uniref:helix-turn-helix transcriptional regulator n=1 Tax=Streptomyces sp. NBC_00083 TaxID=2975647 RepID=UPI00225009D3|nr:LuxR C-terminal-related transcriptional regulator [Streptomyces sp. NBC_00083]MCX5381727.1 LuxR C-terminal-related transcriptional regulator [Streptomyces sp. NBC_00083]